MEKSADALRTISEVATELDVPKHVLRFWESKFAQISPMKRGGGRRYYRPSDIDLLKGIQRLLYGEGFTIRGVQQILKREGVDYVKAFADSDSPLPTTAEAAKAITRTASKRPGKKKSGKNTADTEKHSITADMPRNDVLMALLGEIEECRKILHQS